jgi:hypothetical protein
LGGEEGDEEPNCQKPRLPQFTVSARTVSLMSKLDRAIFSIRLWAGFQ